MVLDSLVAALRIAVIVLVGNANQSPRGYRLADSRVLQRPTGARCGRDREAEAAVVAVACRALRTMRESSAELDYITYQGEHSMWVYLAAVLTNLVAFSLLAKCSARLAKITPFGAFRSLRWALIAIATTAALAIGMNIVAYVVSKEPGVGIVLWIATVATSATVLAATMATLGNCSQRQGIIFGVSFVLIQHVAGIALYSFVIEQLNITTDWMAPTISKGDQLVVLHLGYDRTHLSFLAPGRGDLLVFEDPMPGTPIGSIKRTSRHIRRCVGLPGDQIEVIAGVVSVNGAKLAEPYLLRGQHADIPPIPDVKGPRRIKDGEYFLLGDNRDASIDSRQFGPIPDRLLRAKVILRMAPPHRAGAIE